jgi:hypothetical protein
MASTPLYATATQPWLIIDPYAAVVGTLRRYVGADHWQRGASAAGDATSEAEGRAAKVAVGYPLVGHRATPCGVYYVELAASIPT